MKAIPEWTSVSVPIPYKCQLILSPRHISRPCKLPNTRPLMLYILLLFTNPPSVFFAIAPSGSVQKRLMFSSRSQLLFSSITAKSNTNSLSTSVRVKLSSNVPFLQVNIAPVAKKSMLKEVKKNNYSTIFREVATSLGRRTGPLT